MLNKLPLDIFHKLLLYLDVAAIQALEALDLVESGRDWVAFGSQCNCELDSHWHCKSIVGLSPLSQVLKEQIALHPTSRRCTCHKDGYIDFNPLSGVVYHHLIINLPGIIAVDRKGKPIEECILAVAARSDDRPCHVDGCVKPAMKSC